MVLYLHPIQTDVLIGKTSVRIGLNSVMSTGTFRPSFRGHVPNGLAPSSALDIFELLSTYSPRPILSEVFKYSRNGEGAARIASWNLHRFTQDKATNMGVKEVICRTILENGFVFELF